jgi:PAS domain S-box-containing protein
MVALLPENATDRLSILQQCDILEMLDCFGLFTAVRDEQGSITDFRIEYFNRMAGNDGFLSCEGYNRGLLCQSMPVYHTSGLFDSYCRVVETGKPLDREALFYTESSSVNSGYLLRAYDIRAWKVGDGFAATWRDVSERKRTEERLQMLQAEIHERETRLRVLGDNLPMGFVYQMVEETDGTRRFPYISAGFERMTGLSIPEVKRRATSLFQDLISDEDRMEVTRLRTESLRTMQGFSVEVRMRPCDGVVRWLHVRATPRALPGGAVIWDSFCMDITEQKQNEERLRESERRLAQAQEMARIGSWEVDIATQKITWSTETFHLFQRDPAIGEPDYDTLMQCFHPGDRNSHAQTIQQTVETGKSFTQDVRLLLGEGTVRWIHSQARASLDERGTVIRLIGTIQDITESKLAQDTLTAMTEELKQSNASLKEFTSAASHDLKEPLRKIQMYEGILRSSINAAQLELPEKASAALTRISSATVRMRTLIDGLLTLARVSDRTRRNRYEWVDLNVVLEDVVSDLEGLIFETQGQIVVDSLPLVWGDPLQMRQLLQNLLGNALKYRKEAISPLVRVMPCLEGSHAGFSIRDNGIGFASADALLVFEAFERLDNHHHSGAGVGLAICKRIVEAHGGTIRAEGTLNEGATFTVSLPTGPITHPA